MRTVRDESGKRYLLVERSDDSSRVRDPETGEEQSLSDADLADAGGDPPLKTAATGVPAPVRRVCSVVHDDRSLGLLVELVDRGPIAVRDLLSAYDLCESDLHGLLAEFRAAGLVSETRVGGERGYEATELAVEGIEGVRTD